MNPTVPDGQQGNYPVNNNHTNYSFYFQQPGTYTINLTDNRTSVNHSIGLQASYLPILSPSQTPIKEAVPSVSLLPFDVALNNHPKPSAATQTNCSGSSTNSQSYNSDYSALGRGFASEDSE